MHYERQNKYFDYGEIQNVKKRVVFSIRAMILQGYLIAKHLVDLEFELEC